MNNVSNNEMIFVKDRGEKKIMISRVLIKEKVYRYYEETINLWLIFSWSVLLLSYSFFIVASTLFYEAPTWLEVLGDYGIVISIINFFIAVLVVICCIIVWLKEREFDVIKTKLFITISFNLVSLILYFVLS
ncbi:hypothetical protein AAGG74_19225 [Bacillus mexicanus]|uniref:hypothetical protein n=1 Tax=Bacillus mexicanus TaxID=2834415 RepID=UPI003D1F4761